MKSPKRSTTMKPQTLLRLVAITVVLVMLCSLWWFHKTMVSKLEDSHAAQQQDQQQLSSSKSRNGKKQFPSRVMHPLDGAHHEGDDGDEDQVKRPSLSPLSASVNKQGKLSNNKISSKNSKNSTLSSSSSSQHSIHFITVQTSQSVGWCRNMQSAVRTGISVINLGWGQRYAHSARPKWIVDFLRGALKKSPYPDSDHRHSGLPFSLDDVVLFSDGADTMFTGVSPTTILARFERIAKTEVRGNRDFVMFNAEANCYHQQLFQSKPWGVNKGSCVAAYKRFDPLRRTKWRYLNAGAWIGTVRAALQLFSNVSAKLAANPSLWCDQSVIGGMMLKEGSVAQVPPWKRLILLDTSNSIFLPTYHLRVQRDVCTGSAEADVFSEPPGLVLCHSHRAAAVLHFNGKSGSSGVDAEKRANDFLAGVKYDRNMPLYYWSPPPPPPANKKKAAGTSGGDDTVVVSSKLTAGDLFDQCPRWAQML